MIDEVSRIQLDNNRKQIESYEKKNKIIEIGFLQEVFGADKTYLSQNYFQIIK